MKLIISQPYDRKTKLKNCKIYFQDHFLRDEVNKGVVEIQYCRFEEQVANILTKPLKAYSFEKLRDLLRLITL